MIDRIKAFREPATIVAVVVVLIGIAVTSGRIASDLHTYPLAQVLRGVNGLYGLVDALVLTALALSCVLVAPKSRHAQQLTLAASLLLWLGVVAGLAFLVMSLLAAGETSFSRVLESIGGLTDVALRVLMAYALVLGRRVATAPDQGAAAPTLPLPASEVAQDVAVEPSSRPLWQPDEATGVVWRSASDAASGAAAGTYSSSGGWDVPAEAAELPPGRPVVSDEPTSPRIIRPDSTPPVPRSGPPSWDPAADVTRRDREAPEGSGSSPR